MPNFIKFIFNFKGLLIFLSIALIASNMYYLAIFIMVKHTDKKYVTVEPGLQFGEELRTKLKGVKKAGFLTNKDLSKNSNDGEYLQAQFFLAPTLLDLNNPQHKYNILDYTENLYLFLALKNYNLKPIYDNKYRKVLTIKKP